MSFSNMIQDALSGHGHSNNNNRHDDRDDDFNPAVRYAESHANTSDPSLFTSALSFLNENKHRLSNDNDINEQEMIHAHKSLYGGGESERRHDSNSVGAGAAMQALKMFTSSSEGEKSGMDKNAFIGLAMAQAKKMFEEKEAKGEVVSLLFCFALAFWILDFVSLVGHEGADCCRMAISSLLSMRRRKRRSRCT
jgi:hypothetical protein